MDLIVISAFIRKLSPPIIGIPPEPHRFVAGAVKHMEIPLGLATGSLPKKLEASENVSIREFDEKVLTA